MTMNPFEQSTQQLLRFLTSQVEQEVIDCIRQEMQHDAPDSVPTEEELFAFFQSQDEPTTLDAYQQMLATDKLTNREAYRCSARNSSGAARPCGAAAPRNGDAHGARLRSEGSLLLSDVPSIHAKMAKYALLTAARAEVLNRAKRSEGSDSAPHPKQPLFRRVSRCVRSSGLGWRVYPPSPFETSVAAFVRV